MDKKCQQCGKPFQGNKKKRFCSGACRKNAHESKRSAIIKTVVEDKKPTKEILQFLFPNTPPHLLPLAEKLHALKKSLPFVSHEGKKVIQREIEEVEMIYTLEYLIWEEEENGEVGGDALTEEFKKQLSDLKSTRKARKDKAKEKIKSG